MIDPLSGPDDPRIAEYRHIGEHELVCAKGLFVAESRLVVRRLIEEHPRAVRSLLVSEAALRSLEPVLASLAEGTPIYLGTHDDLAAITGFNHHQGCLALAARPDPPSLDALLAGARFAIVLEGVTNADNVGGVFRNAAAFGADAVLLSPTCCDPLYRKAIRTSMAATLRVPFARIGDWPSALSEVRARGFTIVALTPQATAEEIGAFLARGRPAKPALLLGGEGAGLTSAAEALADSRVRIPVDPAVDSLNLAVAAGIALHCFRL